MKRFKILSFVFAVRPGSVYHPWWSTKVAMVSSTRTGVRGGPEGTTYAASRSGWFDMAKFNQWFKQAWVKFIPYGTGTYLPICSWCAVVRKRYGRYGTRYPAIV